MIDLRCFDINTKNVIELKTLTLHCILIAAPQLFLSDKGIDVHLTISKLAHGYLHWI